MSKKGLGVAANMNIVIMPRASIQPLSREYHVTYHLLRPATRLTAP